MNVSSAFAFAFAFAFLHFTVIYNHVTAIIPLDSLTARQSKQYADITAGSENSRYTLVIVFDIL